ncbi:MAG: tRNA 2-thiouridine(34) synthase MnmA, partial [Patescibacteria group bacterium]
KYGCKHVTLEVGKNFHEKVIGYFIETLKSAKTPNPCIICNRYLKFLELFKYAKKNEIEYVATGHYAKITKSKKLGGLFISKPKDKKKDQTYYLALLPQEWLPNIIFPLSNLTKEEVYQMAVEEDLDFYLKLAQSQDFCFVSEKSLKSFVEKEIGVKKGLIINKQGKTLGKHNGLANYTIGQRKNMGLSGGPYFVVEKNVKTNELVVSTKKSDVLKKEIDLISVLFANGIFEKQAGKKEGIKVKVKIRYQHKPASAVIIKDKNTGGRVLYKLVFVKPQLAVTPGQYAVFHIVNSVVGVGEIK